MFDLKAIMGKTGDQTKDPTLRWDDEDNRPTTDLGKISIEAIVPEETCDAGTFLPGNVVDGIAGPTRRPDLRRALARLYRVVHSAQDSVRR